MAVKLSTILQNAWMQSCSSLKPPASEFVIVTVVSQGGKDGCVT